MLCLVFSIERTTFCFPNIKFYYHIEYTLADPEIPICSPTGVGMFPVSHSGITAPVAMNAEPTEGQGEGPQQSSAKLPAGAGPAPPNATGGPGLPGEKHK